MSKLVKVTFNGIEVQVPEGMGLVEAAAEAGVEIPIFCHHHKLDPVGVCRMCLVEVEGQRKPVTACTMRATDGMVVHTETPLIEHLRKGVIEFLLLNHPLDCPVCDKGGECPLQDNTFKYGPTVSRLSVPKMKKRKAVDMGNFIVLDEERCILCRRCVRFDGEIALEGNLVVGERAHEAMITTTFGQDYDSYFSGNTIELCPVGALTSKNYRFKARPWDLSSVPSICTGCSVGCNVQLDFRFGELGRIVARENVDIDNGWLCDRGRFNYRYIHGEERITQPLIRSGDEFVEVSWNGALMEIANRLRTIRRDHGAESIGFIGGGRLTNEEAYMFQKLAREVVGTPNVDHRVGSQQVTSMDDYSGRIVDIDDADVVLVVDVLPQERMPVVDLRVRRAAQRRGAKLFSIGAAKPAYNVPHTAIMVTPGHTADTLRQVADALTNSSAAPSDVARLVEALSEAKKVVVVWDGVGRNRRRRVVGGVGGVPPTATGPRTCSFPENNPTAAVPKPWASVRTRCLASNELPMMKWVSIRAGCSVPPRMVTCRRCTSRRPIWPSRTRTKIWSKRRWPRFRSLCAGSVHDGNGQTCRRHLARGRISRQDGLVHQLGRPCTIRGAGHGTDGREPHRR